MEPRAYQLDAIEAAEAGWNQFQRQLGVAATGAGKTIMFSHLAKRQNGRTLILAHREELVGQAVDKLRKATGISASVERGPHRAMPGHGVIVSTVQTIRRRLAKFGPDAFDLIICDEAHHVLSDEWQAVLQFFASARVLGVTATPDRGDNRQLGSYFQNIAFNIGLLDLIGQGYLCPIRALRLPIECDVRRLHKSRAKDISVEDAVSVVSPMIDELARAVAYEIWDKKTLVFLPRCDVSENFAKALCKYGNDSRHVSGVHDDRGGQLDWFARAGLGSSLCNAMLLTEGYDIDAAKRGLVEIDCVVILRATKSRPLFCQMVGRGTRIAPGKEFCTVIDPLWITGDLNLCGVADLVAETPLHREALTKRIEQGMDISEAEKAAKSDIEETLAKQIEEAKKNQKAPKGLVDPLAWSIGIHDSDLSEYEPTMPWEEEAPLQHQIELLAEFGMWTENITRGYAVRLLKRLTERALAGLATPKQVAKLRQFKHPNAETLTKAQAGLFLSTKFRH